MTLFIMKKHFAKQVPNIVEYNDHKMLSDDLPIKIIRAKFVTRS